MRYFLNIWYKRSKKESEPTRGQDFRHGAETGAQDVKFEETMSLYLVGSM